MKLKKINSIFLFILISLTIFPNFVLGQITQTVYPTKDAFVGTIYPDDNTGPDPWLWVSSAEYAQHGICEAYIYFDLPYDYNSFSLINLHFYIVLSDSSSQFDILIYRINQHWEESSLTWNNRPLLREYLFSWQVGSNNIHDINVKDHIFSNTFSICIIAADYQFNLGQIPSRESSYYTGDERLALILTNMDVIIISSILGIVAISGSAVAGFFIYKQKKARNSISLEPKESDVKN